MATILTKKSDTASAVPLAADLTNAAGGAELAVNATDKRLFSKTSGGTVVELGTNPSTLVLPSGSANGVAYLNGSKVVTSGSALTFSGSALGVNATSTDASMSIQALTANYASVLSLVANNDNGAQYNNISSSTSGGTVHWRIGGVAGTSQLPFSVGGSEGMRLTSTGLGIGTSSPTSKLTVVGTVKSASGTQSSFYLSNAAQTNGFLLGRSLGSDDAQNFFIYDTVAGATRLYLDSSGNLGLGVTPSAWSGMKAFQLGDGTFAMSADGAGAGDGSLTWNGYYNGTSWTYSYTGGGSSRYRQNENGHAWFYAPSGTAGTAITFTQAMTLDASGNLGLGITSPAAAGTSLHINGSTDASLRFTNSSSGTTVSDGFKLQINGSDAYLVNYENGFMSFYTNGSERARIDSSGNLLVGTTSGSNHQIKKAVSVGSVVLEVIGNNVGCTFYNGDGGTPNAANAVLKVTSVGATGRSINAAGTINAAGLDYAEYMTKSGDFTVAKGDVVGIDAQGKLTNVFANSVSFVVKSTNPSYVGGDTWGGILNEDALEIARQTVDRIAFAGQVPVNVIGATAGQYIVPVNDNGSIKGQAVSNPTFEQYQLSVGKVIAIEADGRARIIVKVA